MAHRTDVHQIPKAFPDSKALNKVTDPVCGMELNQDEAKYAMYRSGDATYFCSKICLEKYRESLHGKKAA